MPDDPPLDPRIARVLAEHDKDRYYYAAPQSGALTRRQLEEAAREIKAQDKYVQPVMVMSPAMMDTVREAYAKMSAAFTAAADAAVLSSISISGTFEAEVDPEPPTWRRGLPKGRKT